MSVGDRGETEYLMRNDKISSDVEQKPEAIRWDGLKGRYQPVLHFLWCGDEWAIDIDCT